jgi:hypothetical protein
VLTMTEWEAELMTPEEINQSYVAITTRAKGPPSITVKVVHRDAQEAAMKATRIFDSMTTLYKEKFDKEQAQAEAPKIAAEDRIDPDEDTSEE